METPQLLSGICSSVWPSSQQKHLLTFTLNFMLTGWFGLFCGLFFFSLLIDWFWFFYFLFCFFHLCPLPLIPLLDTSEKSLPLSLPRYQVFINNDKILVDSSPDPAPSAFPQMQVLCQSLWCCTGFVLLSLYLVLGSPELDTALQVWPHQCRVGCPH